MKSRAPPPAKRKSPLVAEVQRILSDAMGVRAYLWLTPRPGALWSGRSACWPSMRWPGWRSSSSSASAGGSGSPGSSACSPGAASIHRGLLFARGATVRIVETIERDIEPHASPAYRRRVTADLKGRYRRPMTLGVPAVVAVASLAAAIFALDADVGSSRLFAALPEALFWFVTYGFYFFTAAQAVVAARFYLSFADHLEMETNSLYVLAAAEASWSSDWPSSAARSLSFWLMIFLTILSSMLLTLPWLGDYAFPPQSWFLLILVPVAGFFSLGFGTLVYLDSEAKIRATLRRFTHRNLAPLRRRSKDLLPDCGAVSRSSGKR